MPPLDERYATALFDKAAAELGLQAVPAPSANMSRPYTNPLGVQLGPCTYCGFCERFGCGNYSKASPQTTILPVLLRKDELPLRTECEVTQRQPRRAAASARPASPMSMRRAASSSSRPRW